MLSATPCSSPALLGSFVDHRACPVVLKMFGYDYAGKKFKHYGEYSDYAKYTK